MKHVVLSFICGVCVLAFSACRDYDYSVLWLGTSIPQGCTYPEHATSNVSMLVYNQAKSRSFLCAWDEEVGLSDISGMSLCMSSMEKDSVFRKYVEAGELTEEQLEKWKQVSYDRLILPFVRHVDVVVLDHGYNDDLSMEKLYTEGKEAIDWNTRDLTSFIGAFNFIYRLIKAENPEAMIVLGGYFQNSCTIGSARRGQWVSSVLSWMSEHYKLPLFDVWNYNLIPDAFVPGSQNYLDSLNEMYGTQFKSILSDGEGNISFFQKFCPDGVHPFSDPTGESDSILDDIFTLLLKQKVIFNLPNN